MQKKKNMMQDAITQLKEGKNCLSSILIAKVISKITA